MPTEIRPPQTAKIRTWTPAVILGLILSAVGAVGVIELRPQITVSHQESVEKSQPFSTPFLIENSGYLSFHVDYVYVYIHKLKAGGVTVENNLDENLGGSDWHDFDLDRGESKTIFPLVWRGPLPTNADFMIVTDIRPFRWLPSSRRYFRFVGAYVDNWQWTTESPGPIEADADRLIQKIRSRN